MFQGLECRHLWGSIIQPTTPVPTFWIGKTFLKHKSIVGKDGTCKQGREWQSHLLSSWTRMMPGAFITTSQSFLATLEAASIIIYLLQMRKKIQVFSNLPSTPAQYVRPRSFWFWGPGLFFSIPNLLLWWNASSQNSAVPYTRRWHHKSNFWTSTLGFFFFCLQSISLYVD